MYLLGMFASRMLFHGEIVTEYDGTIQHVHQIRKNILMDNHENDGNGILEIQTSHSHASDSIWILNPYVKNGNSRHGCDVPGIWANHRCNGDLGCNMKLSYTS